MSWDRLGNVKLGAQSAHELHLLNVYADPEFYFDVFNILPPEIRANYPKGEYQLKKFYESLLNFQWEEMELLVQEINLSEIRRLAKKYAITVEEVKNYFYGNGYMGVISRVNKPFYISRAGNKYTVRFDDEITKEDFLQIWKRVAADKKRGYGGKFPKNKLPVYDKLLYAVFKSRKKGLSFGEIFEKYTLRTLPYYEKGPISISTEEKLKDYYYKFGPENK
jgi:hypothetical protein